MMGMSAYHESKSILEQTASLFGGLFVCFFSNNSCLNSLLVPAPQKERTEAGTNF